MEGGRLRWAKSIKNHQFCPLTDMMVAEKSSIKLDKNHYEPNLLAERVLSSSDTKLAAPGVRLPEKWDDDHGLDDDHWSYCWGWSCRSCCWGWWPLQTCHIECVTCKSWKMSEKKTTQGDLIPVKILVLKNIKARSGTRTVRIRRVQFV